jgi:hypothetical protein
MQEQKSFLDKSGAAIRFNGDDYQPERDDKRLTGQIERVFNVMKDGRKRTLGEIATLTGDPESSISAQLRHLRKERFGMHTVDKTYINNGLYVYWLEVNNS